MNQASTKTVKVWDPFVRIAHWSLVAAFFIAYLVEDDVVAVHVWAGYAVGLIIAARVVWGVVGPTHARFSDFVFAPWTVLAYAVDLARFKSARYIGHSPVGGVMVVALLIGLAGTVWSGLETYAVNKNAGPLAHNVVTVVTADAGSGTSALLVSEAAGEEQRANIEPNGNRTKGHGLWGEAHEFMANLTLTLIILHILGVIFTSIIHKENLVRAMINGRKRAS